MFIKLLKPKHIRYVYVAKEKEMSTDITKLEGKSYECPLCDEKLEIRFDQRKKRPFCQCNDCGMQLFVRREAGIERMIEQTKGFFDF